jgi:hypothetical protein
MAASHTSTAASAVWGCLTCSNECSILLDMAITESGSLATVGGAGQEGLERLVQRVQPVSLADEQLLSVPRALEPLLSGRALRRGSTVVVQGSVALALALVARASAGGSWVAVVGLPELGVAAAEEAGIVLERLALVPEPDLSWAMTVAALLDAIDVVLVRPPSRVSGGEARRLAVRARERRAVLLPLGGTWPGPADLRLAITASRWEGLGQGHGRLEARRVEVVADGRGAATKERRAVLWLPGPAVVWGGHADQPRHERYVRAVVDETGEHPLKPRPDAGQAVSAAAQPWRGREVGTASAASTVHPLARGPT